VEPQQASLRAEQATPLEPPSEDLDNALLVPQAAVESSQVGKFVYVVGPDNKAEQR
jgi:multidrug efflux pump subunit AcrA (membrane-fusion protein)